LPFPSPSPPPPLSAGGGGFTMARARIPKTLTSAKRAANGGPRGDRNPPSSVLAWSYKWKQVSNESCKMVARIDGHVRAGAGRRATAQGCDGRAGGGRGPLVDPQRLHRQLPHQAGVVPR